MTAYEILGISEGSSENEIRSALRRLAKDCHPDLHPNDPDAANRFHKIHEAYRSALNNLNGRPKKNKDPFHQDLRPKNQGRTVRRVVEISIRDAIIGVKRKIQGAASQCEHCHGEGVIRLDSRVNCQSCSGSGVSAYKEKGMISLSVSCSDCGGSGRTNKITCPHCDGYGSHPAYSLEAAIPAGSLDGDSYIYKGVMSDRETHEVMDLELIVEVLSEPPYSRHGKDIYTTLNIPVWDAAVGVEKMIEAPDGKSLKVTIPPGSSSGRNYRVLGRGLGASGERGDFMVKLLVDIPKADNPTIIEAFRKIEKLCTDG